ncbi:MAG: hypothetical protein ACRC8Y_09205 [Chroococcales cyanobacterium]
MSKGIYTYYLFYPPPSHRVKSFDPCMMGSGKIPGGLTDPPGLKGRTTEIGSMEAAIAFETAQSPP